MATEEQIMALAQAMGQLLDDMGKSGTCVCLAAKAQARVAFEPFREEEDLEWLMSLELAKRILWEADR